MAGAGARTAHSLDSLMVVRQAGLVDFGLFLELLRRARSAVWRRLSFSCLTWRSISRCVAARSRSIRISSSSERRGGEATAKGEQALLALETLRASSSKGSERKRSSSERNEVAWGSSCSESDRDERRGQEGKAQLASWVRILDEVMSRGADIVLKELYDPYEPYIVNDAEATGWLYKVADADGMLVRGSVVSVGEFI